MEVWRLDADGANPRQVTATGGFWPRWSPDGRHLVYCNWGATEPNLWETAVE
jgi:Tol biopolymer transport system component